MNNLKQVNCKGVFRDSNVNRDFRGSFKERVLFGQRTGEVWEQNL